MREINLIVIHAAATPPGMDVGVEEIRRWHVDERGWSDIGYHYVIRRDGRFEAGRPIERQGAHARGYNENSIGVCLVGGVDEDGNADCNYTAFQWTQLAILIEGLMKAYPDAEVLGHRDLGSNKACPVFDVKAWMEYGLH